MTARSRVSIHAAGGARARERHSVVRWPIDLRIVDASRRDDSLSEFPIRFATYGPDVGPRGCRRGAFTSSRERNTRAGIFDTRASEKRCRALRLDAVVVLSRERDRKSSRANIKSCKYQVFA